MAAAARRSRGGFACAGGSARGLRRLLRLRAARTVSRRSVAHAAVDSLSGVARAPLGRPGVSGGVSVVLHAALLGRPHPRTARAARRDGGRAALAGLSGSVPTAPATPRSTIPPASI